MVKGSKMLVDRDYFIHILGTLTVADKLIRDYYDSDSKHLIESDMRVLADCIAALDDIIKSE